MCGIAGFFAPTTDKSRAELQILARKMAERIAHRGPDAGDIWQDPDMRLVLAHRRLSILDLSPAGAQPMTSKSGRYVIIFNGEFYNFKDIARTLEDEGIVFTGRSDTEVFLGAVESWGLNRALQKISGMFAFVLWDRQQKQLHFARDRMGKKPLYIGWAGKGDTRALIFGSELKALRAYPDFEAAIDPAALSAYMRQGWVNAPHTIYRDIWMLKPAHRITLDLASLARGCDLAPLMQPYWHPLEVAQHARLGLIENEGAALAEFEEIFHKSVAERMISDVPLGAFLSGGLDSSAVVAAMQAQSSQPIKTFTIGFDVAGFNEAAHAKDVAAHLGTDHQALYLNADEARDIIPKLPAMFDEPFADISAIPTYMVSHFARKSVTVALSGDGGDEMFGGYNRHIVAKDFQRKTALLPAPVKSALAHVMRSISVERWDGLQKTAPQFGTKMHKLARLLTCKDTAQMYQTLLQNGAASLLKSEIDDTPLPALFDGLNAAEKMMLWDSMLYLPGDILTKVDRASMAASLEARAPFLDPALFAFAWALPLSLKIRGGKGKYILRQYLAKHVPREMFERPKQGFSVPVGAWLRGPLKDWAGALLTPHALREDEFLDAAQIEKIWQAHLAGKGDYAQILWRVLMYLSWKQRWL